MHGMEIVARWVIVIRMRPLAAFLNLRKQASHDDEDGWLEKKLDNSGLVRVALMMRAETAPRVRRGASLLPVLFAILFSPSRRAARAAARLVLACAALVTTSAPADAQTTTTFVSNIEQNDGALATIFTARPRAQQFTTGSNTAGYTLTEITVDIGFASTTAVPIFRISTSVDDVQSGEFIIDVPGSKVVDLTGSVATAGESSFTPTSATTLSGSTKSGWELARNKSGPEACIKNGLLPPCPPSY